MGHRRHERRQQLQHGVLGGEGVDKEGGLKKSLYKNKNVVVLMEKVKNKIKTINR